MAISGYETVVGRGALLKISDRCAACGAPASMREVAAQRGAPQTWFNFGLCQPCYLRGTSKRKLTLWVAGGLIAAGLVAAVLVLELPSTGLALPWYFLPIVLVSLAAVFALWLMANPKDGSAQGRVVRILDQGASYVRIWCANEAFAQALGQLNGTAVAPRILPGVGVGAVGAMAVPVAVTSMLALAVWDNHHPKVWVDALFRDPIVIYVDGEAVLTAPFMSDASQMPSVRVPKGRHTFAWAFEGETAVQESVSDNIASSGYNIYNPGQTACYFRDVTVYGDTQFRDVPEERWGPVDRRALYVGIRADYLFKDAPTQLNENATRNLYRVTLYRDIACTDLAMDGCPESILAVQIDCNAKATRSKDVGTAIDLCAKTAQASCDAYWDEVDGKNARPDEPPANGAGNMPTQEPPEAP